VRIKRLTIHRMPGFGEGGPAYDDLADGLNVIVGTNGSGKTTTCRAIRGLLWGDELAGLAPVSLQSTWTDGEKTFQIDREADRHTWQVDGTPCDAPDLPPADLARCYTVTIDDLFEIDDTTRAGEIVNALAGGYDLAAVRKTTASFRKRQATEARKELDNVKRRARDIQQAHAKLSGEEESLSALSDQARIATEAGTRLAWIKTVRSLNALRVQIDDAQALLNSFPPDMDRLDGKESDALAGLQSEIDAAGTKLRKATREIEQQEARQAGADLSDGGIAPERLDEQQRHLTALKDAERDLRQTLDAIGRAETTRGEALRCLTSIGDVETIDAVDVEALNEIDTLQRDIETNRANCAAAEGRLKMLDSDNAPCDTGEFERSLGVLREWLSAESTGTALPAKPNALPLWVLTALLVGASVILAALAHIAWLALAVVGGAVAFWGHRSAEPPAVQVDRRAECQTRFAQADLAPPESWTGEAVGRRIRELEQAVAKAHIALERQAETRSARQQLEQFFAKNRELDAQRAELARRVGVAPNTGALALTDLATNLREFRLASAALKVARMASDAAEAQRCGQLEKINAFLQSFGLDACDAYDDAQASSDRIKTRADDYANATAKLAAAHDTANDAQTTLTRFEGKRAALFAGAALDDGDDRTLAERLAQLDQYRDAKAELRKIEVQKGVFESQLTGADDLLALTPEALDEVEADLDACAARRDDILATMQTIRGEIDRARAGHDLGDALAARERAAAAVNEQREVALRTMAGEFLLDGVEAEYRADSEPGVLRRARQWFARFTHHRYTLQAAPDGSNGGAAFRAVDTTTNRGLGLDELSRGTRMQLLLAVRLAFAAEAEKHRSPLPFILDEVLSSSDPERFKAIIDCLLVLVRQGRQVFYFTCQPGDAKAWSEAADRSGITDARLIDLDEARRSGAAEGWLLSESTTSGREIPAPDGASLAEYGRRLGAAGLDPSASAARAHVAHIVDDAEQLYALARAGIETVGPLRNQARIGPSDGYIAPDALARALARAELLDAFADAWSVGRGRPLTREDLAAAGVSDKFIDNVSEIGRELDWNAERLMAAIEAREDERLKGFRAKTIETMSDWMHESGHLSSEQRLGEDEARARVLAAGNDHVIAGTLGIDNVGELFAAWWRICSTDGAGDE